MLPETQPVNYMRLWRSICAVGWVLAGGAVIAQPTTVPSPSLTPSAPTPATGTAVALTPAISGERITLGDGTLRLKPGNMEGEVTFILSAEQLGPESLTAPKPMIVDEGIAGAELEPTKVQFTVSDAEFQPSATGRRWLVLAKISALPLNGSQTRYATVQLGSGVKRTLNYVLSNLPPTPVEFSIEIHTPWLLSSDEDALPVVVATRDQAVTGFRLANSTLAEKTHGAPIGLQTLLLCRAHSGACEAPGAIPAMTSQTFFLRMSESQRPHGRFSGTVAFAVDARAETSARSLEISSSSSGRRWVGAGLIVVGVMLAWWLTEASRARFERLTALVPFTAARKRIEVLLARLDKARTEAGVDLSRLRTEYEQLTERLSESELDQARLLPSPLPLPWKTEQADAKAALKEWDDAIGGFHVLVRDGVEALMVHWRDAVTDKEARERVVKALKHLDAPGGAATEVKADALIAEALAMLAPPQPGAQSALRSPAPATSTTPAKSLLQRVTTEIKSLTLSVWIAYGLLVSVGGIAVLIIANPGFGTLLDFIYCLFWGFGLPVALDKLQQLSPSGMSTTIGIGSPSRRG